MIFESPLLKSISGIRHAFGTRSENFPFEFETSWKQAQPHWKQVHGNHCREVTNAHQECGETDALWTSQLQIPIAVVSADCVPILLARADGKAVAAIHSGWRGTMADISGALAGHLARLSDASKWHAAIGPAIGPCCYQVSEELAHDFTAKFTDLDARKIVPHPRMLDLPRVVEYQLKRAGIAQVELLRTCTQCTQSSDGPTLESFRRDGKGTRQFSVIEIIGSATP